MTGTRDGLVSAIRRWTLLLGVLQITVGCLVGLIPPSAVQWFRGIVMAHIEYTANGVLMIAFGAILEGAPALIIFGPLLAPIAQQLGVHPLHFGTVMVIAMGLGLFSPPIGLGLFATCAITGTRLQDVARPMVKYLMVLFLGLLLLVLVPAFSLWLPGRFGLG